MRFEVVKAIYRAAVADPKIHFLTGDLAHANVDDFKRDVPEQYLNVGMAEQNMVGIAAGLALSGKKVFAYSIAPFTTLRCFEQIKVDVCYHNVDVTVIGVGGGFAYGSSGATHYSVEDIAALRALPNMKVVCPGSPYEGRVLAEEVLRVGGPAYIRLGKGGEQNLSDDEYPLEFGKARIMRECADITIIATGTIVSEALRAADLLKTEGIGAEVVNMHTVKPLDTDLLASRAATRRGIFTLEEHSILGGLGGAVAEFLSETGRSLVFRRFGVGDVWPKVVGTQQYLRRLVGIDAEAVKTGILEALSSARGLSSTQVR